ncbi:hypothetical protein A0U91_17115 (plasmid) [Acetobacter persici]|uniref:Uncharacterized protein n=1 Tax=Acetobacter persici TaxID=1076596 RepID=A0A1U9LJT9_9PROT|nr:hypothetical protein A0U91_17115 [Acetobacter persici]
MVYGTSQSFEDVLDARWSWDSKCPAPLSPSEEETIYSELAKHGFSPESLPPLDASLFSYAEFSSAPSWLQIVHDDFLPDSVPVFERERICKSLISQCGYQSVITMESGDGIGEDIARRHVDGSNWSAAARRGYQTVMDAIYEAEWCPVLAVLSQPPAIDDMTSIPAADILEGAGSRMELYRVATDVPQVLCRDLIGIARDMESRVAPGC